jgi:hypothetical protein
MRTKIAAAIIALAAIGTTVWISTAFAACPPGTTYGCVQGFNGKVICGCH